MKTFWVYENWRARGSVAKVHASDCPFCNEGRGLAGGTRADNGNWRRLGNFADGAEALNFARQTSTMKEVRRCGHVRCG